MNNLAPDQIRRFRLHTHHLDAACALSDIPAIAGACGLQNSPPGAWESALHVRVPSFTQADATRLLEEDKTLLQAWSFRGAPVVFPADESPAFLTALIAQDDEPWIYTQGIGLALDALGMTFGETLALLKHVIPGLDDETIKSKQALDQTLADWITPHLPVKVRDAWNAPSMYGSPDKQTVGGAAVSFLLRPCAFLGLVVLAKRKGATPTFTSYKRWLGHAVPKAQAPDRDLVRKYLHAYGPATQQDLAAWLGASPAQARRLWQTAESELAPVTATGKTKYILAEDLPRLEDPPTPADPLHLLSGHDPYLGLPDRALILPDKSLQRKIWQTVANPGAILYGGEIIGMWKAKKAAGLAVEITLWDDKKAKKKDIEAKLDAYAAFQQMRVKSVAYL